MLKFVPQKGSVERDSQIRKCLGGQPHFFPLRISANNIFRICSYNSRVNHFDDVILTFDPIDFAN